MEEKRELKKEELEQVAGGNKEETGEFVPLYPAKPQYTVNFGADAFGVHAGVPVQQTAAMPGPDASTAMAPATPAASEINTISDPVEGSVYF